MKIISIHQGHFLPWLGYWNKVYCSDVFVWLNTVQFRKNYFQNRVNIKDSRGEKAWLTVPVSYQQGDPLSAVMITTNNWKKKLLGTMQQSYGKATFFKDYFPCIAGLIEDAGQSLDDMNFTLFMYIRSLLDMNQVQIIKGSSLVTSDDPTQRLIDICKNFQSTHYIAGKGGTNYMRMELFEQSDIEVIWQRYHDNQPEYQQINGPFIHGMSIIDPLFNIGAAKTVDLIRSAWRP